jgi:hypothetical protein
MEDVLDLYHEPYDPLRPVVCFDESNKQLISEKRTPLPPQPSQPQRCDYEYERHGTCNLFMFAEPLAGWRHVEVTEQRTMIEYADCMKYDSGCADQIEEALSSISCLIMHLVQLARVSIINEITLVDR